MVPDFVCFSFTLLLEMKMAMSMGFPHSSLGKESACNVGDLGWIPGLGRSPAEEKDYPLWYSGLENSMALLYSPWDRKESGMTEQLSFNLSC